MESLMASALLLVGVLAVITAIMGGWKSSLEAQRRMEAALIAEELMGQIAATDYADLGSMAPFQNLGLFIATTSMQQQDQDLPGLSVRVSGTHVLVVVSHSGALLAEAELFIPEPQS